MRILRDRGGCLAEPLPHRLPMTTQAAWESEREVASPAVGIVMKRSQIDRTAPREPAFLPADRQDRRAGKVHVVDPSAWRPRRNRTAGIPRR